VVAQKSDPWFNHQKNIHFQNKNSI